MYENLNIIHPTFGVSGVRKGTWSVEEDELLRKCIQTYGEGNWKRVPKRAGLNRCRKSCRWRWLNYLKPSIKRGGFSDDEIGIIVKQRKLHGNRWSLIADRLPGRTINDVKNYCNTHIYKKFSSEASSVDKGCNIVNDNDCNKHTSINNKTPQTTNTLINNTTYTNTTTYQSPVEMPLVIDTLNEVEQHDSTKWWEDILLELQRNESEGISNFTSGPGPGSIFGVEQSNVNSGIDKLRASFNELSDGKYGPYIWEEDLLEFDANLWG